MCCLCVSASVSLCLFLCLCVQVCVYVRVSVRARVCAHACVYVSASTLWAVTLGSPPLAGDTQIALGPDCSGVCPQCPGQRKGQGHMSCGLSLRLSCTFPLHRRHWVILTGEGRRRKKTNGTNSTLFSMCLVPCWNHDRVKRVQKGRK